MTARELLRQAADVVQRTALSDRGPVVELAAALRALADRFDAEKAAAHAKVAECVQAKNPSALATWFMIEKILARLDASPIAPPGPTSVKLPSTWSRTFVHLLPPTCRTCGGPRRVVSDGCQHVGDTDVGCKFCVISVCPDCAPPGEPMPNQQDVRRLMDNQGAPPGEPTCPYCTPPASPEVPPEAWRICPLTNHRCKGRAPESCAVECQDAKELAKSASPEVPRCAEWCGTYGSWCSFACERAGHPLHPAQPGGSR